MSTLRIGDKCLSEIVAQNDVYNAPHPVGVELVEDVVKQQYRRCG